MANPADENRDSGAKAAPAKKVWLDWAWILTLGILVFVILAIAMPRGYQRRPECLYNIKQLGLSLLQYDELHRKLPPPYLTDASGKPLLSWRVLILPILEQQFLFDRFDRNEPWNSPHNLPAAQTKLEFLHCPEDNKAGKFDTSYVAIVGPGFLWDPTRTNSLENIPDGAENTIMLVEMKNSGIQWAEPRDLDLGHLPSGITKENLLKSLSNHHGGFNAVFADGSTMFLPDTIPWDQFMALLTIDGGEKIERETW